MPVSKVIYAGNTLIDLTGDTVQNSTLLKGYTAHGRDGSLIQGSCDYDSNTSDATVLPSEILEGKTAYSHGQKIVGTMINNETYHAEISTKNGMVKIPQGRHDGDGTVTLKSSAIADLKSENIVSGVTILGVTGNLTPGIDPDSIKVTHLTVSPSTEDYSVSPRDKGDYDYFSRVYVAGVSVKEEENTGGGITVKILM